MGRVVRLTEQELRGIVTDLIKMALTGGDLTNQKKPQDSENDNKSTNDKVSAKGQELLNDPIFKKKLKEISNAINIDENSIIKLMKHESGLNPEIKNVVKDDEKRNEFADALRAAVDKICWDYGVHN